MAIGKYRYYLKKPKSEIAKDVLLWLAVAGIVTIAATSPYFIQNILRTRKKWEKYPRRKVQDSFSYLKKRGFITIDRTDKQLYISLTEEGKHRAGMYQIDSLEIPKPTKWDHQWRILIFDVQEMKKIHREALRGKLKELGFFLLQKSVWVHPFNCAAEIELLRDFFGLSIQEMCLITANHIEDDDKLREFFHIA